MDVGELLLDGWVENRCGPTNGMSFVFLIRQRPAATGIHESNNTQSIIRCFNVYSPGVVSNGFSSSPALYYSDNRNDLIQPIAIT